MGKILVIGTASLDTLHFGETTVQTVGGAGMYTALAAVKAGASVTLCGPRPANDDMPEALCPIAERVTWIGPVATHAHLPRLEIRHHGGGKATLLGASWGAETSFTPSDLPADVSTFDVIHIAALSSARRQLDFLRACRARGARCISVGTYARIAYGDAATVRQLFAEADWGFMNENEAKALFGDVEGALPTLRKQQGLCITLAERGAAVLTDGQIQYAPAPAAQEVDPTGAGDTVCGTFLSFWAQGMPSETSVRSAIQAASDMIRHIGPAGLLL